MSLRNRPPLTNSIQQQFLATLKWGFLLSVVATGFIMWKLVANASLGDVSGSSMLDLPRDLCGTVVRTNASGVALNDAPSVQSIPLLTSAPASGSTLSPSRCDKEYHRVMANTTKGLSEVDFEHSRALIGNRRRLAILAEKLQAQQQPVNAIFCGGSITIGHGVHE